jgi:hypothetical protein
MWGFGFIKREKKLAHITIRFLIVNPYNFLFYPNEGLCAE